MLAVSELSFRYARNQPLLFDGLDYRFDVGSLTAVTGLSGRGKSTLLYMLGLMLTPSGGHIELMSRRVPKSDSARAKLRASHIGFVFQDAALDPSRTVEENVVEAGIYAGMDGATARRIAGELMNDFGVSMRGSARATEISGGQAQRVALCRALLKDPRIILADEPTGNLDRDSSKVVWNALEMRAHSGAIVVVATHDLALASLADAVLEL